MSGGSVHNQPSRSWKARTAAATALLAVTLIGGPAVAHADSPTTWELTGPDRPTREAAKADIPSVVKKCRQQGGQPINSGVYPAAPEVKWAVNWAVVYCRALRG